MDISTDCCICSAQCISSLWNISTSVCQVLDGRVVQTHVKTDTLCEQRWPPEHHPGKKSGHTLYLQCHQGTLGTVCLQKDSNHVFLWPCYHLHHDTVKHGYTGIMKESTGGWDGALLSSVMRVGSVCMRVMDVHVYGVDLESVIFLSALAHDTKASLQASWCGGPSVRNRGHIWCLYRVKNSARHIAQVVNLVLLPFLRQEGDVLFQQNNVRPHTAAATQRAL